MALASLFDSLMLRTLHVVDTLNTGGTEWQSVSLAGALSARGIGAGLVCLRPGGVLADVARRRGVRVEEVGFPGLRDRRALAGLARLARLMRREHVDLVQSYGFYSNLPALLAARLARVPVALASRRDMGEFLKGSARQLERVAFRLATRVVVNANAIRDELTSTRQVRPSKVVVIPTGVDLDRFDRNAILHDRPAVGLRGGVVAMVARFRRQKDHPTFLQAARMVLADEPGTTFLLAGDGYLRESIETLARDLGVSSSVRFVGPVEPDAMPRFLFGVDVAVLASKGNEGIPNVILEAMAAGKPVVATDTGGCREAVHDGVTGFLVPPGDAGQLAGRILRLLGDGEMAARMGKAGRGRVESEFSLARMADRFTGLYEGLLQAAGRRHVGVS
jgi:L-malate glycosyltransferase